MPYLITFLTFIFAIVPTNGYTVTNDPQAVSYYTLAHINEGADVILAHEDKAGATFYDLQYGDLIQVGYPNGMRLYRVTDMQWYWATMPKSIHSGFINEAGITFSSEALVKLLYVPDRLILQTCFMDGRGRLFVIAERMVIK